MKRLLTLVLALAMVLSLAACGSKKPVQLTADGGAVVVLSAGREQRRHLALGRFPQAAGSKARR